MKVFYAGPFLRIFMRGGGAKFKRDAYGIARIRHTIPNVTSKNIVDESDKFRFETKYVMVHVS